MKTAEEILKFINEVKDSHTKDYLAAVRVGASRESAVREVIQINLLEYVIQGITEEADDEQEG